MPEAPAPVLGLNRAARAVVLSTVSLGLVVFVIAQATILSPPMLTEDAADYAAIARNVARGRGFTTDTIRPITLSLGLPAIGAPDVTRPPVYVVLLSLIMRGTGPGVRAVQIASFIGLALCAVFLFLAAWRAFEWKVAVVAASLLALNPGMLQLSSTGTATIWAATWMAALALCLSLMERGPLASPPAEAPIPPLWARLSRGAMPLVIGCVLALAYLTEYTLILLFVPVLWHVLATSPKRERWRIAALVAAGFFVLVMPWWIRNYRIMHNPLFTLDRYAVMLATREHPGFTVYRTSLNPGDPWKFLVTHPRVGIANLARLGNGLGTVLPRAMGPLVFVGGVLLYFTGLKRDVDHRWRWTVLSAFAAISLVTALTIPFTEANYLTLVPWMALLAGVWLTRAVALLVGWRRLAVTVLLGTVVFLSAWRERGVLPAGGTQQTILTLAKLAPNLPPKSMLVVTDVPQLVVWYLDQPALWLPTRLEDMRTVSDQAHMLPVLYLSSALDGWPPSQGARAFQQIRASQQPPNGYKEASLGGGDRLFYPAPAGEQGATETPGAGG
jgi:hypothetical protein